ncbi:MAG TPA: PaaI family thioesterase [Planctomycetes bacterium]|nr:PaaI family thioesterase [Planctomycetaceae bacterium]HIN94214.1 PaaI family thioesterase [Planctomycetota bacterium]
MSQDNDSLPVRDDGHNCFVCGPHNAIGLRVKFQLDGDVCRGEFTPGRDHCGYDGITHGGILFSLLDDVMANWLYLKGLRCFTAKCEIRYRNPLPVGCRVLLAGKSLKRKRNVVVMEGLASRADTAEAIAECQASFFIES